MRILHKAHNKKGVAFNLRCYIFDGVYGVYVVYGVYGQMCRSQIVFSEAEMVKLKMHL